MPLSLEMWFLLIIFIFKNVILLEFLNKKDFTSFVKAFKDLVDANLILIQRENFDNLFSNGLLIKYCILMEKYKKDIQKNCVSNFESDLIILVINQNINCVKLLNSSVILRYPVFLTLVLNSSNSNKNMLNKFFLNEISSYVKEQSSLKYIFYQVRKFFTKN